MKEKPVKGERRVFMTGNEVCAWAALAADADIMFGYPITPQTDIMQYWTRLAPKYGKKFLQTEDEISAGFTTLGAVIAGKRAFSATTGPGNVLFQEPMSMAEMMRIPVVLIIPMRGGPSTATVIYSQQEVTMTAFGGNGEGFRVVYSTAGHQDLYDYTIKAFNTAWKYRFPTFVLSDGYQGKMRESLTIYDPAERGIEMVKAEPMLGLPGIPGVDRPTRHLRNTYNTEEELYEVVMQIARDFEKAAPEIVEWQDFDTDSEMDVLILAHGVVSRAAQGALPLLKNEGIKAGHFRPITLRPMPEEQMRAAAARANRVVVVESAYGQFLKLVKETLYGMDKPIDAILRPGVGITAEEIVAEIKERR
ncbi:MAG: ferredoxin oxidoreductase [Firmicutes bacterium]|nr:ferredoxin oxidoreductase [Bacillota bacterium]HOB34808.1 transketolase C-terminal domain-containing protein [Bacillota bacterium]HQE02085.1 transketolase C-terminal domain-containing protein [Bacillota bacterium]